MEIILSKQETLLLGDAQAFDFPSVQKGRSDDNRCIHAYVFHRLVIMIPTDGGLFQLHID